MAIIVVHEAFAKEYSEMGSTILSTLGEKMGKRQINETKRA
jgi:hypothetical protein